MILSHKVDYRRDTPTIVLTTSGIVRNTDKDNLKHELAEVGLDYAKLEFIEGNIDVEVLLAEVGSLQNKFSTIREEYSTMYKKLYEDNEQVLEDKNKRIEFLEQELTKYQSDTRRKNKPIDDIALEFATLYPEAVEISYNELIKMNTKTRKLDTIPTVVIDWNGRSVRSKQKEKLAQFFQTRMKLDTIELVIY